MDDLIKRKDVLDALDVSDFHGGWSGYSATFDEIESIPAVVDGWVPCADKLPDTYDMVIITYRNTNPEPYHIDVKNVLRTAVGHYYNGKWYWHSPAEWKHLKEFPAVYDNLCMHPDIEVVAWMPMPDPYVIPERDSDNE